VAVAKHWVKVDKPHLDELKKCEKSLDLKQRGLTDSNKARLRQFDDPKKIGELLLLPAALVKRAKQHEGAPRQQEARLVQTALMLELLHFIPMRRHNLAALDIDRHVTRRSDGSLLLFIPGAEVKNAMDIEAVLPTGTVKLYDLYLTRYRPLLVSKPTSALFPGRDGKHKTNEAVAAQITNTVKAEIGVTVSPHLFRHIAVKLYLDRHPGNYGVVQRLIGHHSPKTTLGIYGGMEAPAAVAHYDKVILDLRDDAAAGRVGR
jgi:site-specific recombinase XerD